MGLPYEMKTIGESLGFTTQKECDEYNQMVSDSIMSDGNETKPKFKVGDWIIYRDEGCTEILRISGITKTHYICIDISDDYCRNLNIKFIDSHNYHLWTIQDAKDGDVLVVGDEDGTGTAICGKNDDLGNNILCCYYDDENGFAINTPIALACLLHPATKEQRDLLFKKMHEAGYEWNLDTKELKKIGAKQAMYDKHAWDEESDYNLKLILATINHDQDLSLETKNKLSYWLKSFKDRVQLEQKHDDWNHTLIKN